MSAETGPNGSSIDSLLELVKPITTNFLLQEAFRRVDRGYFVPQEHEDLSYRNEIIPLGDRSSISEPVLVAEMIDFLGLTGQERVLEIGTGSGYGAALLSHCSSKVFSVEVNEQLANNAKVKLESLGYGNINVRVTDGALGIPEEAPFDAIMVTASTREVPRALVDQLKEGGRIIIPVGKDPIHQTLILGLKYHGRLLLGVIKQVSFHSLMSKEDGGWTEELLEEAKNIKIRALYKLIEIETGRKDLSEQEARVFIAKKLGADVSPDEIDIIEIALTLPMDDDLFNSDEAR